VRMPAHRARAAGLVAVLVSQLLSGCSREATHPDRSVSNGLAASAGEPPVSAASGDAPPASASAPAPAVGGARPAPLTMHVVRTTLAKMPAEVALPAGWRVLARQSDEGEGLVAFGPDDDSRETATAFLDGSQVARVPASPSEATTEALARDACAKPSACALLGAETIPGGYLVSVRMPRAIAVESWHAAPGGRALRCGFERSALDAAPDAATWLDEPDAVAQARREGEDICRSAKAAP
jgi:hypothetical protein